MYNLYKINAVKSKKTRKGDDVFSIQLDNSVWINNINPEVVWLSSGLDNKSLIKAIHKYWMENNYNLDGLIGKYIFASYSNSDYGLKFDYVKSVDIVGDFKKLLDKSNNRAFFTDLPIYSFLENRQYKKNEDNSISLRNPYHNMRIVNLNDITICYEYTEMKDVLTIKNIELIYNKFYKGICPPRKENVDSKYELEYISIIQNSTKYYTTTTSKKDKKPTRTSNVILTIGDKLNDEQLKFLKHS